MVSMQRALTDGGDPNDLKKMDPSPAVSAPSLPVAPSMGPSLTSNRIDVAKPTVDRRLLQISALSTAIAIVSSFVALGLVKLITLITNISFYHRFSFDSVSPADNALGLGVVLVPTLGGVIVGLFARFGSKAIRGHGIPEAMEQVLSKGSIVPARLTFLKPISAAISIGTGGPFGAEGPIIASGGALGSLLGQLIKTTAHERKTLLAAGAAAGMTAIFGCPIAGILLAVELLVFEYRPRSLVPIACGSATASTLRILLFGSAPAFALPTVNPPAVTAMLLYLVEGVIVGAFSVVVTKAVYWIEDQFEKLPLHWMWWPAIGGLVVGVIGYWYPHTMGVGYDNIDRILSGEMATVAISIFCFMKFLSWSISLGTGTSGGTLAPLFTIGGGIGLVYGNLISEWQPNWAISPSVAALVGMAAIFAGASRALMASVVFAFETTRQPWSLLPLLAGGTAAYILSCLRMKHSIMTEKIARRGITVPEEFGADPLSQVTVKELASRNVVSFLESENVGSVLSLLSSDEPKFQYQGYPVVTKEAYPAGLFTRKDLRRLSLKEDQLISQAIKRPPICVLETVPVSNARDLMAQKGIGRVLVTDTKGKLTGILTRSDVLNAYSKRLLDELEAETKLAIRSALRHRL